VNRFAFILLFVSCSDAVDKAAKKRIFSAEDPPQAVASASQKLPPEEAANTVSIARRILGMGAAEATERIGPHHYTATVTWEWTQSGKNVRLKETRDLKSGRGGVSGDFIANLFNSNEQGLEVIRAKGAVFARSTWGKDGAGKFRQRLRDRGMAERMREEAFGALKDYDSLFNSRLQLAAQGTATVEGRTVWKYAVSLGDEVSTPASNLPAVMTPKSGVDETTRRRLEFFALKKPRTLEGEILVDADTSVVVKARLDGRIVADGEGGGAELHLVLDSQMSEIGQSPVIEKPAEFLPDEDKPDGVASALLRFGIDRKKADAGVPADSEPPDDDDDSDGPGKNPAAKPAVPKPQP
jgi:hypothetical protein